VKYIWPQLTDAEQLFVQSNARRVGTGADPYRYRVIEIYIEAVMRQREIELRTRRQHVPEQFVR
jgi:hypothetical protein